MLVHLLETHGKPFSFSALTLARGYLQRGAEIKTFELQDIATRVWEPEAPVIVGVGGLSTIFKSMEISYIPTTYPVDLQHFLGRKVTKTTLGKMQLPCFIKPALDLKTFTGFVCHDRHDRRLGNQNNEAEVFTSEIVEFTTEYRVYICQGKIQNVARYTGPVDVFPNMQLVRDMISSYVSAPIAYSVDIGITKEGETLLVEVNDALALGNYGIPATLLAKMHEARWNEIVGLPFDEVSEDSPSFISNV